MGTEFELTCGWAQCGQKSQAGGLAGLILAALSPAPFNVPLIPLFPRTKNTLYELSGIKGGSVLCVVISSPGNNKPRKAYSQFARMLKKSSS